MEKKIEDYMHLYKKCEVITPFQNHGAPTSNRGEIHSLEYIFSDKPEVKVTYSHSTGFFRKDVKISDCKLLLRPLSDMTEEEQREFIGEPEATGNYLRDRFYLSTRDQKFTPEQFQYLLGKGIDLFHLIKNNLALDKTKL